MKQLKEIKNYLVFLIYLFIVTLFKTKTITARIAIPIGSVSAGFPIIPDTKKERADARPTLIA